MCFILHCHTFVQLNFSQTKGTSTITLEHALFFPLSFLSFLSLTFTFYKFLFYCCFKKFLFCLAFSQGIYSTQIFSLPVLLSSMFVYNQVRSTETWISFASFDMRFSTLLPQDSVNFLVATVSLFVSCPDNLFNPVIQMGGIDEVALDCLSLVTEMTRHIRVKASGRKASASKLGQFSPVFIWFPRVIDNLFIITVDFLLFLFVKLLKYIFLFCKRIFIWIGSRTTAK